jgi:hypothetical protein
MGVRRGPTTNGIEVDQEPVAGDGGGTPQLPRRRLYVSVTLKFVVAEVVAAGWLGVSVWLSLSWVRELATAITIVPAVLVVGLIASRAGWSPSWPSACCSTASRHCGGPSRPCRSPC